LRSPPPALLGPTVRALVRTSFPGYLAVVVGPGGLALVRGGRDLAGAAAFAVLAGAAGAAFCVEDATPFLASTPVSRAARHVTIGVVVAVATIATIETGVVLALVAGAALGPVADLGPEAAAAAALSLAVASWPTDQTAAVPPPAAAFAALSAMALSGGLHGFNPVFGFLPIVGVPDHAHRWWVVAGLALVVFTAWHRDPATHRRRRPRPPAQRGERDRPGRRRHRSNPVSAGAGEARPVPSSCLRSHASASMLLLSTSVLFLSSLFRKDFKRLTRWSSRLGDLRPLHHYLGLNSAPEGAAPVVV
jgi:hypothetical protein